MIGQRWLTTDQLASAPHLLYDRVRRKNHLKTHETPMSDVTRILSAIEDGDAQAAERLTRLCGGSLWNGQGEKERFGMVTNTSVET